MLYLKADSTPLTHSLSDVTALVPSPPSVHTEGFLEELALKI